MTDRPVPVPDPRSAGFWAATAEGVLAVARCPACSRLLHPPAPTCPACGADVDGPDGPTYAPTSGRGRVRSWTVVRRPFLPGFEHEVPYVLVDVELDDQEELRLVGRLLDGTDTPVALDAAVEVAFEPLPDGSAVPAFRLAG